MDWETVQTIIREAGEPAYRAVQARKSVFETGVSSYQEISNLPASLKSLLAEKAPLLSLKLKTLVISKDERCRKAALECGDGKAIETVLLRPSDRRWTVCVSSQVGCAVGCPFCATGFMGMKRNLTAEEITDQVLFWRQFMRREKIEGRLSHVVYMGMGEPFASYENVSKSLKILMDQGLFNLAARHISVSSSGIAPKIVRFAEDFPQVNFALSLHAASDELRTELVPMNKAYPLAAIREALKAYLSKSSRKVFLEYILLKGKNDRPQDAENLIRFVRSVGPLELLHVNLIIFNEVDATFEATLEDEARLFQSKILACGIHATVRQNLGRDIQGACGQLIQP
jgi:23S rRNA (adenine(2503)-C(2))-methyltransferase